MSFKNTISITEARKRIFQIADEVQKPGVYYTLTENGRPKAAVISAAELESWAETLAVAQEFPDLKKDIAETEADYKSGKYKTYVILDELLAKDGYIVADTSHKKYEAHRTAKAKSTKKSGQASRR